MVQLTHLDENQNPRMVDITEKNPTLREACAEVIVELPQEVINELHHGDIQTKKGPVFQTAIIAGTMSAKNTSQLIPFCHQIPLEKCQIKITLPELQILKIQCTVKTFAKTGVEMEALVGASTTALTIYDMCKALSHDIKIQNLQLIYKTGGKSDWKHT